MFAMVATLLQFFVTVFRCGALAIDLLLQQGKPPIDTSAKGRLYRGVQRDLLSARGERCFHSMLPA